MECFGKDREMKMAIKALRVAVIVAFFVGIGASAWAVEGGDDGDEEATVEDLVGNKVGPTLGFEVDRGRPYLGVDGRFTFDVHDEFAVSANPAIRYMPLSGSGHHFLQIDGNALAKFPVGPQVTAYGGMGLALIHHRFSGSHGWMTEGGTSDSRTRLGLNLLIGGVEFDIDDGLGGFAQMQLTRYSSGLGFGWTMFSLGGGVHFDI